MKKGHKMSEYERVCHHFPIKHYRPNGNCVKRLIKRFNYECQICGEKNKYTVEIHHIIPLKIGGKNDITNLVCLCANCHRKVHAPLENVSLMTA